MSTQRGGPNAELIPYDSLFPPEDAQKAARRVLEEITEHQKQLERLHLFSSENTDLINLVRRLPDDLQHDIMVPFGKAAFFPGRLIHTNEFLVLLGEGYYVNLTAKNTVGVLKRRGEVLESKMEALSRTVADLKATAEFFDATAGDSMEGIVEIREFEEPQKNDAGSGISSGDVLEKENISDEEFARIISGLDDLEKAEFAAQDRCNNEVDGSAGTKSYHQSNDLQHTGALAPKCISLESTGMETSAALPKRSKDAGIHTESGVSVRHSKPGNEASTLSDVHRKAFTGVIVEHDILDSSSGSSQATISKPSRPVSRFKMQRGC